MNKINQSLKAFLLLCLSGFLWCCTDEGDPYRVPKKGEQTLTFSVQIPIPSVPNTYALDAVLENAVKEIDILLFDDKTDEYTGFLLQTGEITVSETNNQILNFTVQVPEGKYNMVFLANCRNIIAAESFAKDDLKSSVLAKFKVANDSKWNATSGSTNYIPIPMWGETLLEVNENTAMSNNKVSLVRMLAKINVSVNTAMQGDFKLSSIQLYNYMDAGLIAPIDANMTGTKANDPSVIGTKTKGPLDYTTNLATEFAYLDEIYTFEAAAGSNSALPTNTCLVIGGNYKGGNETYYRIDFQHTDNTGSISYLPLLRNHCYDVIIGEISADGYKTQQEAFDAKPMNIATITVLDESKIKNVAFDGQYMLGVSEEELTFTKAERTDTSLDNILSVSTDYPKGWEIEKIVDGANNDISSVTNAISGWLTLTPNTKITAGTSDVRVVLKENTTGNTRTGFIYLRAGRLPYVVKVTQTMNAALFLAIRDDATNMNDITELAFHSKAGVEPAEQSIRLTWMPADKDVTVSSSTVGTSAFTFNAGSDTPGSGSGITYSHPSGIKTLKIQPVAITTAELSSDPFLEKTSKVEFTVNNGTEYMVKSIYLKQFCYAFVAYPDEMYHLDGSTQTLNIRCNTDWRIKSVRDQLSIGTKSLLASKGTDTLKSGYEGTATSSAGTDLTFTVSRYDTFHKGTVEIVFESPAGYFSDVTVVLPIRGEHYPAHHTGWAGSNIYWDGNKLTFDDFNNKTHQYYQGLYFQFGSLWGISPVGDWSPQTILYSPTTGKSGSAESFGYGKWDTAPYVRNTVVLTQPPAGKTLRDRSYLYEAHLEGEKGIGDICMYITEKGWAPGYASGTKWRMPTSQEFEDASSYSDWTQGGTIGSIAQDGTTTLTKSFWKTDNGNPTFVAAGNLNLSGVVSSQNNWAYYWSGSATFASASNFIRMEKGLPNPSGTSWRQLAMPVRCVRE